jgi:CD2 antigen cytoplasmic tail-binding protein 2
MKALTYQSHDLVCILQKLIPQMAESVRPKRAGDDFARIHDDTSKKPRFDYRNPSTLAADAPEDDVVLDADVIGKSGRQIKRNAVNIDGYESDSDDDNFNSRAAAKARQKKNEEKSKDEEDADMFAEVEEDQPDGDDDEELRQEGKLRAKNVRFMDNTEIEGQNMDSTSGGRVSTNFGPNAEGELSEHDSKSDESSGDEEERDQLPAEMEDDLAAEIGAGGKKRHAPRLEAFNLKAEEEEGRFDESLNFVRKAVDPDALNDNWLEGLSKKDMKRAKEAQERRENDQRRKALEDDAVLSSDLLSTLIQNLETGETSLEALQRLNKGKTKEAKVPLWKQKKMRGQADSKNAAPTEAAADTPAEVVRKQAVAAITGAADRLYTRGQHDIYDVERELLRRQYRRETGEDWQAPAETRESNPGSLSSASWEYRWSDARDGGQKHGPYDLTMMKAWNDAGYFGEGVEFKRTDYTEWSRVLDVGE